MNILVVFTGGTIGSSVDGEYIELDKSSHFRLINMYNNKFGKKHNFTTTEPFDILSENLTYTHIFALEKLIKTELKNGYDGIIVTHGTDTLQYTAAALSYLLGNDTVPIVIVSSNKPLGRVDANGLDNFSAAIDFIEQSNMHGVYVSYRNCDSVCRIHAGTRTMPHIPYDDNLFSINNSYVGTVVDGVFQPNKKYRNTADETSLPIIQNDVPTAKILYIPAYVGLGTCYENIDTNGIDGVLFSAYHSGTLPVNDQSFINFCEKLYQENIPAYLCGEYMQNGYSSTKSFGKLMLKRVLPISPIAMLTKLTLFAMCGRLEDVNKRLCNDFDSFLDEN